MKLASILITIAFTTGVVCNVLAQNTSPLPAGDTEIGNHFHAGAGNEVWSDASALYFNYRGNAATTYFWNLGNSTGKPIMTLLNNGNVGIGTPSPQFNLDILGFGQRIMNTGSTGYTTFRLYNDQNNLMRALEIDYSGSGYPSALVNGGPSGESASITTTGSFPLTLGTNNAARVTIANGGNVGIGTMSPVNKLEVDISSANTNYGSVGSGDLGLFLKNTSATNNNFNMISFGDASGYGIAHVGAVIKDHTSHAGNLIFATKPSGSSLVERMRIDENGNVGVGTASPAGKLDINAGSQYAIRTLTSSRYVIEVRNTSDTDGGWWLVNDPNGSLALHENSVGDQFTIKPGGNVGIGTTSPDAKLAVSGQVHAQEVKVSVTVPGPDYVFEKDYKLTSLEEIKDYIDQNKHLPEVPSAKEMEKNGIQLGEMNMLLLKKIEELTLHVIELKRENAELKDHKNQIDQLRMDLNKLTNASK
jgi:hypothetical protein